MSDIIKSNEGGLVSLLHGKGGGLTIPKPFRMMLRVLNTLGKYSLLTQIEG